MSVLVFDVHINLACCLLLFTFPSLPPYPLMKRQPHHPQSAMQPNQNSSRPTVVDAIPLADILIRVGVEFEIVVRRRRQAWQTIEEVV